MKKSNEGEESEDETNSLIVKRKPKGPTKLPKGMVSTNFVKLDMKHKNYIHGNKGKMTGAKYKRQEWKRKASSKFGRKI